MSNVFFYEPFYDVDRFIDEAFSMSQGEQGGHAQKLSGHKNSVRALKPKMDLHEDSEKNIVTAAFEFPGVSKENIQIDLHNGRLVVSAETKESTEHELNGYAVRERRFGKSSRTLQIPVGVKEEDIKASMENGVLTITFPKTTPELASKKITIA